MSQLEPLRKDNYSAWAARMRAMLTFEGLQSEIEWDGPDRAPRSPPYHGMQHHWAHEVATGSPHRCQSS